MTEQLKRHQCQYMPKNGVDITCNDPDDPFTENAWVLTIYHEASAHDLEENHHLESIGEIIWQNQLHIYGCPFCSEQLCPPTTGVQQATARHFDYSN